MKRFLGIAATLAWVTLAANTGLAQDAATFLRNNQIFQESMQRELEKICSWLATAQKAKAEGRTPTTTPEGYASNRASLGQYRAMIVDYENTAAGNEQAARHNAARGFAEQARENMMLASAQRATAALLREVVECLQSWLNLVTVR